MSKYESWILSSKDTLNITEYSFPKIIFISYPSVGWLIGRILCTYNIQLCFHTNRDIIIVGWGLQNLSLCFICCDTEPHQLVNSVHFEFSICVKAICVIWISFMVNDALYGSKQIQIILLFIINIYLTPPLIIFSDARN